jgi:hypothetical protein
MVILVTTRKNCRGFISLKKRDDGEKRRFKKEKKAETKLVRRIKEVERKKEEKE